MKPLPTQAQSVISTIFISVVPIFMIYALNLAFMSNKESRERITLYMLGFAIGGLLGDVFFHTLPHMSAEHGHHENANNVTEHHHHDHHGHSHAGLEDNIMIIVGILTFFVIEKVTHTMLV
jgi:hypothetical protein